MPSVTQKSARITAPHFVAGAIFEERDGKWVCVQAAPIIHYLTKMEPGTIKSYLKKKGWKCEWI